LQCHSDSTMSIICSISAETCLRMPDSVLYTVSKQVAQLSCWGWPTVLQTICAKAVAHLFTLQQG